MKKIFVMLIAIVGIIIVGAFLLNTLLPNVVKSVVNAVEDSIYKATKMSFDFNGDNDFGNNGATYNGNITDNSAATTGGAVDGFN